MFATCSSVASFFLICCFYCAVSGSLVTFPDLGEIAVPRRRPTRAPRALPSGHQSCVFSRGAPAVVGGWLLSVARGAWLAPSLHGLQALSVQRLPAPVTKAGLRCPGGRGSWHSCWLTSGQNQALSWVVLGPGFPEVLSPLPVGGAGSLGGLLRGSRGLRAGVGLLVGGPRPGGARTGASLPPCGLGPDRRAAGCSGLGTGGN